MVIFIIANPQQIKIRAKNDWNGILDNFIFRFFGNSMWDYAPDSDYGMDYTIQYWDGG